MNNFLYAMLIIFIGFSVGCGVVGVFILWRLKNFAPIAKHAIILLVGVVLTQGILLTRLVQVGTAQPSLASWFYLIGLVVQSVGLLQTVQFAANRLAEVDAKNGGG